MCILLCHCDTPRNQAQTYITAATQSPESLLEAVATCQRLEPSLQGECAALSALSAAPTRLQDSLSVCAGIQSEVWRDECFFLVAETSASSQGLESAAQTCHRAGRFADNCLMHVWKQHAETLLDAHTIKKAASLYAESLDWCTGALTIDESLIRRFWSVFFDHASASDMTNPTNPYALESCIHMGSEIRGYCHNAGLVNLRRNLNRASRRAGAERATICTANVNSPRAFAGELGVHYTSSRALDGVVEEFVKEFCQAVDD